MQLNQFENDLVVVFFFRCEGKVSIVIFALSTFSFIRWPVLSYILDHINGWNCYIQFTSLRTNEQTVLERNIDLSDLFDRWASTKTKWQLGNRILKIISSHLFAIPFSMLPLRRKGEVHSSKINHKSERERERERDKRNPKGHLPGKCYYIWFSVAIVIVINCLSIKPVIICYCI